MTRKKQTKQTIVIKMEFDLVDWTDDTYIPAFAEVASTLKVISMYRQTPESFTKAQTGIITSWLKKNSVEKFVKAKMLAEKHQAMFEEDCEIANDMMWTKRVNTNH
ncbi:MAG: hypothetical protein JHC33_03065 [Ignisphaera sp.]|nr:hypothetical protein [Ignisphaera sp.]